MTRRRVVSYAACAFLLVFLVGWFVWSWSQPRDAVRAFGRLRLGMTEPEVRAVLGEAVLAPQIASTKCYLPGPECGLPSRRWPEWGDCAARGLKRDGLELVGDYYLSVLYDQEGKLSGYYLNEPLHKRRGTAWELLCDAVGW